MDINVERPNGVVKFIYRITDIHKDHDCTRVGAEGNKVTVYGLHPKGMYKGHPVWLGIWESDTTSKKAGIYLGLEEAEAVALALLEAIQSAKDET